MKNEERINIRVVLHDLLSKPAKKIREEQERLNQSAKDASKSESELGKALDDTAKSIDKHRDALEDNNSALDDTVKVGKKYRSSQKSNTDVTDADTGSTRRNTRARHRSNVETSRSSGILTRVTKQFKKTGRGMLDFSQNYLTFIGMFKSLVLTDLAPAIPVLITGITALASGAIALLGPIAKLGSNIAHLLPLYATMGTLMAVTTMAFSNMGDAISALNDPTATVEEINEALSKLGPNAQNGARSLAKIAKGFQAISGAVQETYWGGGMADALTKFSEKYLPIFERGLINASKHMRDASIHAMKLFGGKREQKSFSNVLEGSARSAGKIGILLAEAGRVLLLVTESAMPVFEDFLEYMSTSLHGIGDNIDTDALTQYFREAGATAKSFWEGLKDIGGALRNMSKGAKPLTDHLSGGLSDILDKWNKWTGSDEGQKSMNQFFSDMIPNFDAMGNLIGSLWDALGELGNSEWFAPFVNDIADNVIPNISKIIKQLSDNLLPVFIDVSEAFTNFTKGQDITVVQPLIDAVTTIGKGLEWIFNTLAEAPPGVKDFLIYMSGLALIGVPVIGIFSRIFKILKPLGGVFSFVGKAFGGLFKGIGEIAKNSKIGGFFSRLLGWFGKLGGKLGLGGLMKTLGFFGKRLLALAGPVGVAISLLWAVWEGLKWLYNNFEWFRNGVDGVVNWIKESWTGFVATWRDEIIPTIGSNIDRVVEWFRSIPTKISEFVSSSIAKFVGFVTQLNTNITAGIAGFVAGVVGWFVNLRNGIASRITSIVTRITNWVTYMKYSIMQRIREFAVGAVKRFLEIRDGVKNVIQRVKDAWSSVMDWLKLKIVKRITDFVTNAVSAFGKIGSGVRTAMDKIRSAASKPVDFVVNTVYNNGIRAMWNKIANTFDLKELPSVSFSGGGGGGGNSTGGKQTNTAMATGGVLPGYSPGKDIHHFSSPTAGNLHLSGGEAIMRPEFTRQVGGEAGVHALNKLAMKGGLSQAFAKGGVTEFAGDLASKAINGVSKAGKAVWGGIKNVTSAIGNFVTDPVGTIKSTIKNPAEAMYGQIHKSGSMFSEGMLQAPKKIIGGLMDNAKKKVSGWFKPNEMGGGGQLGAVHMGPPPAGGSWVRPSAGPITQRYGVPGVLSGLAHAGTDIAGGGKTYSAGDGTVYATGSGILGGRSGLGIGISHGGGIFTYYGHNPVGGIQVSPGQKVKAGQHIGYQGSTGNVTGTHLHFELHKGGWGRNVNPSGIGVYDTGGWLMPGQMAMNMSNSPEPILNGEQFGWLKAMATQGVSSRGQQHVGGGSTTMIVREGDSYDVKIVIEENDSRDNKELARFIRDELKRVKRDERERR